MQRDVAGLKAVSVLFCLCVNIRILSFGSGSAAGSGYNVIVFNDREPMLAGRKRCRLSEHASLLQLRGLGNGTGVVGDKEQVLKPSMNA